MKKGTDLQHLLSPASIAIVGASDQMDKISSIPLKMLMDSGYKGHIFPVNPQYDKINGLECFADVEALPEVPDVVMVVGSGNRNTSVLSSILALDVPFLIMSPGENGSLSVEDIRKLVPGSKTIILGPDSFGFINLKDGVLLACYPISGLLPLNTGNIGFIAQDGALGFSFYSAAVEQGINFRYIVTAGYNGNIDCLDIGEFLLDDQDLDFLVFSFHELSNGRRFMELVEKARLCGIPVAVIHTAKGGDVNNDIHVQDETGPEEKEVWKAVFQQYGVIEILGIEDLIDLGHIFSMGRKAKGNSVGIISTSPDAGALMRDRCSDMGLHVPSLLSGSIYGSPSSSCNSITNPIDISTRFLNDPSLFSTSLELAMAKDQLDMTVVVISLITPSVCRQIFNDMVQIFRKYRKPMVCCWLPSGGESREWISRIEGEGIPVFSSFRSCAKALSALSLEVEVIPRPLEITEDLDMIGQLPAQLTEYHAKLLLSKYGVVITEECLCNNLEEAIEAADSIGYPVALKVMSPNIVQKSQARIIALDLRDSEEVRNAYGRTLQRAIAANPEAEIIGVLVQEMLEMGVECMINAKRDPVFGPVISVGLGGIYLEFLDDRSNRIAPVGTETAVEMIRELKGYPILKGLWGQSGYDIDSLARIVSQVSEIISVEKGLDQVIINPIFVRQKDAVVVDAFIIRG